MSKLNKLCEQKHVRIQARYGGVEPNPDFMAGHHPYLVTLYYHKRQLTVPFYMGPAHTSEPTAADVLSCIISDTSYFDNAKDIDDFAAELGYTSISQAVKIYRACEKMSPRVHKFLGEDFDLFANAEH